MALIPERIPAIACAMADVEVGILEDPATDVGRWWAVAIAALDELDAR